MFVTPSLICNAEQPPATLMSKHASHFHCHEIADLEYKSDKQSLHDQDNDCCHFQKGCELYDHESKTTDPKILDINDFQKYQFIEFIHRVKQTYYACNVWYKNTATLLWKKQSKNHLYPLSWSYPCICPCSDDKAKAIIKAKNKELGHVTALKDCWLHPSLFFKHHDKVYGLGFTGSPLNTDCILTPTNTNTITPQPTLLLLIFCYINC